MSNLGAFEQLILFSVMLLKDGAYGVAIRDVIEERTGRAASIGAIYTTLGRLEERGLLRSRTDKAAGRVGRPRKFYRMSRDGARALQAAYTSIQAMAGGLVAELERRAGQ